MRPTSLALIFIAALLAGQTLADIPAASQSADPAANLAEYHARVAQLKDDDAEGRLAIARWARDRQMWPQAVQMAQAALFRDPGNRAAYLILQQVDEGRPLPADPAVEDTLKADLSKRFASEFKTRSTRHFLLCYDTTDTFAAQRGAAMEKVFDAFQFYFNMDKLHTNLLDHRLIVILFKDRSDYLTYAIENEHTDLSWTSGFYSQRSNCSVFYDDSTGLTAASFKKQTDQLRAQMDDLARQIAQATAAGQTLKVNQLEVERSRDGDAVAQLNNRSGNAVRMLNNVKTLHEAAHQIAFNTGIQKRMVDYPLWFAEGLACSFETEDATGHRGPAVLNPGRLDHIKDAIKAGKLLTVEQLVTEGRPEKMDEESAGLIYAEGWGLFHYLYRFNRQGMEKYLISYNAETAVRPIGSEERKRLFTDAFGDKWEELNNKFTAYLRSLPSIPVR